MLDDALVLVKFDVKDNEGKVSILVVLDDALVRICFCMLYFMYIGLNPCCAGRCSSTPKPYTWLSPSELSQSLLCWTML